MEILGQSAWLVVLIGGTVVLALAIAYGMSRNKQRSLAERVTTEAATRAEYAAEDRDRS